MTQRLDFVLRVYCLLTEAHWCKGTLGGQVKEFGGSYAIPKVGQIYLKEVGVYG